MKKNESVTHIMSADVVSVGTNTAVSEAKNLMAARGVHHLPVTENGNIIGILSAADFLRVSFGDYGNQDERGLDAMLDHTYKIADLMNANPVTIEAAKTIRDAAFVLSQDDFHSLPVVEGERLVGIVTSTDLIKYLLAQY